MSPAPSLPRLLTLAGVLAAVGLAVAGAPARAATTCPSFTVLHDDRIGAMSLPAGAYRITPAKLTCESSSHLFTAFLDDFDGKLPAPWHPVAQGSGRGRFTSTKGGPRFSVRRSGSSGGGTSPLVCTRPFTLAAADRIGSLKLKAGRYRIDRLGPTSPSCGAAAKLLGSFLEDFDGRLPGGWVLLAGDGAFVNTRVTYGFRIGPWAGSGGHARRYPTHTTRCPATFRVLHNDRVGALRFPAGPYWVNVLAGSRISCAEASNLFGTFLDRPNGSLPKPWVVDRATGTFRHGKGSPFGFAPKPAFDVS